jgi:FixJ family two-component response regulator
MPQMNGRELADRLLELRPNLRVLFISGYADDALIHRAGMNGEVRFLAKPFSADGLADRVRAALDGAPRTAGLRAG